MKCRPGPAGSGRILQTGCDKRDGNHRTAFHSASTVKKTAIPLLLMALVVLLSAMNGIAADSLCVIQGIPGSQDELAGYACTYKLVVMAQGESDGIPIRLVKENDSKDIRIVATLGDLTADLYLVKWIPDTLNPPAGAFDPMVPLQVTEQVDGICSPVPNQFSVPGDPGTYLLWLKITTTHTADQVTTPGARQIILTYDGSLSISVPVTVCDVALPVDPRDLPVINMANISWNEPSFSAFTKPESQLLDDLLKLLKDYRLNASSGFVKIDDSLDVRKYGDFLQRVSGIFREVRIPAEEMFSRGTGHSFTTRYGSSDDAYAAWLDRQRDYFGQLKDAMSGSNLHFSYKFWDEPAPANYPEAKRLYGLTHEDRPDLSYEITEPPDPGLCDAASCPIDVWTVNIKQLVSSCTDSRASCFDVQHANGQSVRTYANVWLGLNRPVGTARTIGWVQWYYELDGYHFAGFNQWAYDPWKDLSSDPAHPFHRAALVYPDVSGCWCGMTGTPLPSLRLEAFRDGIEDMLILRKVAELGGREKALQSIRDIFAATVEPTLPKADRTDPPSLSYWHDSLLLNGKMEEAAYGQWHKAVALFDPGVAKVEEQVSEGWNRARVLTGKL